MLTPVPVSVRPGAPGGKYLEVWCMLSNGPSSAGRYTCSGGARGDGSSDRTASGVFFSAESYTPCPPAKTYRPLGSGIAYRPGNSPTDRRTPSGVRASVIVGSNRPGGAPRALRPTATPNDRPSADAWKPRFAYSGPANSGPPTVINSSVSPSMNRGRSPWTVSTGPTDADPMATGYVGVLNTFWASSLPVNRSNRRSVLASWWYMNNLVTPAAHCVQNAGNSICLTTLPSFRSKTSTTCPLL